MVVSRRRLTHFLILIWLSLHIDSEIAFAQEKPDLQTAAAAPPVLEYPAIPTRMDCGHVLNLSVKRGGDGPLQYRWFAKHMDEEWDWSTPWTDSPDFEFKPTRPALYDIQVDVREKDRASSEVKKWLGTIEVHGPLIVRVSYTPQATVIPVDKPVSFVVRPANGIAINSLEFRLWDLLPTNRVYADWQPWPLPDYKCDGPKSTGLQIDVRMKKAPAIHEMHWLNDFSFQSTRTTTANNLIRSLIADDFAELDEGASVAGLSEELQIAISLLAWDYDNLDALTLFRRLQSLSCVAKTNERADGRVGLMLRCGREYELDPKTHSFRQLGSPVSVDVSLAAFPRYRDVFNVLRDKPESLRIPVGMTYATCSGYFYGTRTALACVGRLQESVASCQDRAVLLHGLLRHAGMKCSFVEVSTGEAGHLVLQVDLEKCGKWILDPTTGLVYSMNANEIGTKPIPEPIRLPTKISLPYLELRNFCKAGTVIGVFEDYTPGVSPIRPTTQPTVIQAKIPE